MKRILPKGIKPWVQEGGGKYHYLWYVYISAVKELSKQHDFSFTFIFTVIRDEVFRYGYDENEMFRIGDLVLAEETKDPEYNKKLMVKWEPIIKRYYQICKEIDDTNLTKLSDKNISDLYKKFSKRYVEEYALPMIADAMGYYLETKINEALKKHLKNIGREKDQNRILAVLGNPISQTFLGDEKYELFLIVKDYLKGKDINEKIKHHQKKWPWTQNNYLRAIILDKDYFTERVKEHSKKPKDVKKYIANYISNLKKAQKEKEELMDELEFDDYLRLLVKMIDEFTLWQDRRKKANLVADHYIALFLQEANRRSGISMDLLEYTTGPELQDIFDSKEINMNAVKKRLELCGIAYTKDSPEVFDYKDAVILEKELDDFSQTDIFGDIHGTVANLGKTIGIARIINSPTEFHKMKDRDILVTSMTRPEFIPIMKKASAIVTDEGGITSHAAIVSRELGVPCIIGTKVATKVLKDGDEIEVNANHGIVRKIE